MKNINLNDYVICKIRACHIYLDNKRLLSKLFNSRKLELPDEVVGYAIGQYDEDKKVFNVSISLINEKDMNKSDIYNDPKDVNVKKSLDIAIKKLNIKSNNRYAYQRLANKRCFFQYKMVRVMKYTLSETVSFVVSRLMKKYKITDINNDQIRVKF